MWAEEKATKSELSTIGAYIDEGPASLFQDIKIRGVCLHSLDNQGDSINLLNVLLVGL